MLETIKDKGCKIEFLWYHDEDDEDIKELGEEYQQLVGDHFRIIANPVDIE